MSTDQIKKAIQQGWDEMSESYQAETHISLDDVHYAPLCPGERDLRLIGDVAGKRTLELACGAAQNSIALAKWGAHTTALDFSSRQLAKAKQLASQESVNINLVQGDMESPKMFPNCAFDVVLSCFGWEFIPNLSACLAECHRILRNDRLLIVGTVHPLTAFEWDAQQNGLWVTDYFNPPVEVWDDLSDEIGRQGMTFFRTFQEMFSLLTAAGFRIEDVIEPFPYPVPSMTEHEKRTIAYGGAYWESQYERLSRVPFSIVYRARKIV